jgi:hypothetical protein
MMFSHIVTMKHWLVFAVFMSSVKGYSLVREYSGQNFFDLWDFYGDYDNTTEGNAIWANKSYATSQKLAYIDSRGNAIIKVDNTTDVLVGQNRSTVRLTSQDTYDIGSLWIIDLSYIPFGCSVWPAFWTFGPNWPEDGEIDIIEGINMMTNNQMSIHTTPGCTQSGSEYQLGTSGTTTDCSQASGCTVTENSPNSYGSSFAAAGGGVWATQFDVSGIFIWFWSRPNVPASINQPSMNVSQWGTPHASYFSNTCNITKYYSPQNLVIDITLCGVWAGVEGIYDSTCSNSGPTGSCYEDCVVGPGSPRYDDAYFNISYVRAYTSALPSATSTPSPTTSIYATMAKSSSTSRYGGPFTRSSDNNGWGAIVMLLIAAPTALIGSWPLVFKRRRHRSIPLQPA